MFFRNQRTYGKLKAKCQTKQRRWNNKKNLKPQRHDQNQKGKNLKRKRVVQNRRRCGKLKVQELTLKYKVMTLKDIDRLKRKKRWVDTWNQTGQIELFINGMAYRRIFSTIFDGMHHGGSSILFETSYIIDAMFQDLVFLGQSSFMWRYAERHFFRQLHCLIDYSWKNRFTFPPSPWIFAAKFSNFPALMIRSRDPLINLLTFQAIYCHHCYVSGSAFHFLDNMDAKREDLLLKVATLLALRFHFFRHFATVIDATIRDL